MAGKEKSPHHGEPLSPQVSQNILAEWREDYRLAKLRNETGVEPASGPIKHEPARSASPIKKQPRREKDKGIDIPF